MGKYERIKNLREDKDLTQKQLAEKLQIAQSTLSNWERAKAIPSLYELPKLAEALQTEALSLAEILLNDIVRLPRTKDRSESL